MPFDPQPVLANDAVRLRGLRAGDGESLYAAGSDPKTWAGHPAKDRYRREVFEPYVRFLLESGTTLVVEDAGTGKVIGCSRYYVPPDRPDAVAIGFTFLDNAYSRSVRYARGVDVLQPEPGKLGGGTR